MPVTVLTPAPVTALIELASVKALYGLPDSEDANTKLHIKFASATFRKRIGRELARQQYKEAFYLDDLWRALAWCYGGETLRLSFHPVDSASLTVSVNGSAVTDFEVRDAFNGILFRRYGWFYNTATADVPSIEVTYKGGLLIPGQDTVPGLVTDWKASQAYKLGAWVRPVGTVSVLRFECTTAGTSHASTEPAWPATAGQTITDGTVVWTARQAWELPEEIQGLAGIAVRDLSEGSDRPAGLASSEGDGFSESYFASSGLGGVIPAEILDRLEPWRMEYGRV